MLEKILLGLFKGFFMALGWIIQSIYRLVREAIQRNSRDVYSAPAQGVAFSSVQQPTTPSSPPPPLSLPPLVEPDGRFSSVDKAIANAQYDEALHEMVSLPIEGEQLAEWHFKVAHRCFELWKRWGLAVHEPKREDFEEFETYMDQSRKHAKKLRCPLETGCKHIEKALTLAADYPLARLLGRELHGKLAQSGWDWGPKRDGFFHQKRVIELSDVLIDYDTLDLAQRCALEAQLFGDFFDMTEELFKNGRIEISEHFYAAMVYEGAVHQAEAATDDEKKWPLSAADQKRAPEFIKAALAHLEYCERHKLERGPHWHNIMARVLASRGQFEEATYHFGQFKSLAAKTEHGDAMIAVFGNPTVRIIKAYLNKVR